MTPDQAFAFQYFQDQARRHEQMNQMNQKILDRQTFHRAAQQNAIEIAGDTVTVKSLPAAVYVFGHQPQMLTPTLSQALHDQDPVKLGEALSEIWQGVRQ